MKPRYPRRPSPAEIARSIALDEKLRGVSVEIDENGYVKGPCELCKSTPLRGGEVCHWCGGAGV